MTKQLFSIGAAICAAAGLGLHADFSTAINTMTRPGRVFHPIEANRKTYEQLYQRVYLKMYKRLQPMYAEIAAITGYPEAL